MRVEELLILIGIICVFGILGAYVAFRKRKPIHVEYSENLSMQSMQPIKGDRVLCIGMDGADLYIMPLDVDTVTTGTDDLLQMVRKKLREQDPESKNEITLDIVVGQDLNYTWIQNSRIHARRC
jgi:hypothetical protein